jgi:hypothetical protein
MTAPKLTTGAPVYASFIKIQQKNDKLIWIVVLNNSLRQLCAQACAQKQHKLDKLDRLKRETADRKIEDDGATFRAT